MPPALVGVVIPMCPEAEASRHWPHLYVQRLQGGLDCAGFPLIHHVTQSNLVAVLCRHLLAVPARHSASKGTASCTSVCPGVCRCVSHPHGDACDTICLQKAHRHPWLSETHSPPLHILQVLSYPQGGLDRHPSGQPQGHLKSRPCQHACLPADRASGPEA